MRCTKCGKRIKAEQAFRRDTVITGFYHVVCPAARCRPDENPALASRTIQPANSQFIRGFICAVACLIRSHGDSTEARELFRCAGSNQQIFEHADDPDVELLLQHGYFNLRPNHFQPRADFADPRLVRPLLTTKSAATGTMSTTQDERRQNQLRRPTATEPKAHSRKRTA